MIEALKIKCIFFVILCFILSSCALYTRKVKVKTTPSHAKASLLPENKKSCITPCKLEVPNNLYKIKITKEGYSDKIVSNPERRSKTRKYVDRSIFVAVVAWIIIFKPYLAPYVFPPIFFPPLDDKLKVNLE